MSMDVQMFVLCDHIVRTPKLGDPVKGPELFVENSDESILLPGTYYVAYSFVNKYYNETNISPITKIYVNDKQALFINLDDYANELEKTTTNIYVARTSENFIDTDLSAAQIQKENEIKERLHFQDNIVSGELYEMIDYTNSTETQPTQNSTSVSDFNGTESRCPRCYGKGYYYDIFFDKYGRAVTATKSQKLLQECLKVLIDDKLGNKFHPEWGCDVSDRIGTKNKGNVDKLKVELAVRQAIERLKKLQLNNQLTYMNIDPEEMIDAIQSISVTRDGPTGYNVDIVIVSSIGDMITYNIKL